MPQLTLEYSNNVIEKDKLTDLFLQCHELLAKSLPTDITNCKSRAYECKTFVVGDGDSNNGFVHVSLEIKADRTKSTLQATAQKMMEILANHFAQSMQKLNLQITLEIIELPETYFKIAST